MPRLQLHVNYITWYLSVYVHGLPGFPDALPGRPTGAVRVKGGGGGGGPLWPLTALGRLSPLWRQRIMGQRARERSTALRMRLIRYKALHSPSSRVATEGRLERSKPDNERVRFGWPNCARIRMDVPSAPPPPPCGCLSQGPSSLSPLPPPLLLSPDLYTCSMSCR
ncbi:hypothetical protein LX36DRAFT_223292 [Colletotrichum falcatum]|nr:hypothetical protein LX36DRAFT_223292 [Colletotrichum falcatum]